MHPLRKQRLIIVCFIVAGASIAAWLMATSLSENLNLFYDPSKVQAGEAPVNKKIRVGGMVVKDSVKRINDGLSVRFVLTDYEAEVPVEYTGILPDLFDEESGAVATGILTERGLFVAEQVLAKHDENYMPPEVAKAIEGKHSSPLYTE